MIVLCAYPTPIIFSAILLGLIGFLCGAVSLLLQIGARERRLRNQKRLFALSRNGGES